MMNRMNLEKKTYEIMLSEARNLVHLYAKEWTDFHPSDPGLTILENLTAFEILQQSEINEMTVEIQKKLLELVGVYPEEYQAASVLVKSKDFQNHIHLCKNQKLYVDDLCFETAHGTECGAGKLEVVYRKEGTTYTDISDSLNANIPNKTCIWGEEASEGTQLLFVFSALPEKIKKIYLQLHTKEQSSRNPFSVEDQELFAKIKWELWEEQKKTALKVEDESYQFLQPGTICLSLPDGSIENSELQGHRGYVICATLVESHYEVSPEVVGFDSGLFQLLQQETHAYITDGEAHEDFITYKLEHELVETGYLGVYVKENTDQLGYYEYRYLPATESPLSGRYYESERTAYGELEITFYNHETGYGPDHKNDSVLFSCMSEEMMLHRNLGMVYGYDNQRVDITPYSQVVKGEFAILAELQTVNQETGKLEKIYEVFQIETEKKNGIYFELDGLTQELVIKDAGAWEGANIYIGNCITTSGRGGNILPGNTFVQKQEEISHFINPFIGKGGCSEESIEEMKKRFATDMKTIYTVVTKEDFEEMIRTISGLCIELCHVYYQDNKVHVVAKPKYGGKRAQLPVTYVDKIKEAIDNHKLLATEVEMDTIEYIPLLVNCSLYTSNHAEEARRQVQSEIQHFIEEVLFKRGFGEPIIYSELYQYIQKIESVDSIYELSVIPLTKKNVEVQGADIYPRKNGLCYLEKVQLELRESDFTI